MIMPAKDSHPLSSISAHEISVAAAACKSHAESLGLGRFVFNTVAIKEPPKQELLAWEKAGCPEGGRPPRQAFCILRTPETVEVVVSLEDDPPRVVTWREVPGVHPLLTLDDCLLGEKICREDPQVQKLVREVYGITDMEQLVCDPWSVHQTPFPSQRVLQLWLYKRSSPLDNHYAHPLSITPLVDLNLGKVIHIDTPYGPDPSAYPPLQTKDHNYCEELYEGQYRTDLKELNVVQPEGPSWTINGEEILWQKWRIRVSFNYREGLVLHNVGYEDQGRVRPILHRASLAEMAVPYGDPHEPYHRKCAFDVGDYGLGNCANNLKLGCDCLGNIHYFPAWLNNNKGEPVKLDHAVCLHEEDYGLSWKHSQWQTGKAWSRRLRRLVLSFICTVVNYEYAFYWYFYTDGNIGYEIKATGELSTNQTSVGEDPSKPEYGTLVAPGVNAAWHQHLFSLRLDPAIDDDNGGKDLVVTEVDAAALPRSEANPHGNAFGFKETELLYEKEAQRVCDASVGRVWKMKNPNSRHPSTGKPVAYTLLPAACPLLLAPPGSAIAHKAQFATKHLWVTPHSDEERFPAGDYPLQHPGGDGLPAWTAGNRSLKGADPVLWYTFGLTHFPRPEDYPTMPVDVVGFLMKPSGFFEFNPALDMPPGPNKGSVLANGASNGHSHACCS